MAYRHYDYLSRMFPDRIEKERKSTSVEDSKNEFKLNKSLIKAKLHINQKSKDNGIFTQKRVINT